MGVTTSVFIPNQDVQASIIAKMKDASTLVAWLTARSVESEIRENQWQGRDFTYPATRVDLLPQVPLGNPPCVSEVGFNVHCFSESDSSRQADTLAGLVEEALARTAFIGTGYRSGLVRTESLVPANRTAERIWQATVQFIAMLQKGTV